MANEVTLSLVDAMRFELRTGSGHSVMMDASSDVGGQESGPRPMEMLLAALAGCAAMDVIAILRKMRQEVNAYAVSARGETAAEHPQRYVSIEVLHRLTGEAIVEANVRRAISLSMSRYCPVYAILAPTVPIGARFEIHDGSGAVIRAGTVAVEETDSGRSFPRD